MFENIPKVKIGIVAVSRDCFPESLSVNRRKALVDAYKAKYEAEDIYECPVCIVAVSYTHLIWVDSRDKEKAYFFQKWHGKYLGHF